MANGTFKRKSSAQQSADVRISDRGNFAYAETGQVDKILGIVPFGTTQQRDSLNAVVPPGVFFFNTETNSLEISDPQNTVSSGTGWISLQAGQIITSGSQLEVGIPTDGTFTDGAVHILPTYTIADAIDAISEFLVQCNCITFASHLGLTDGATDGRLQDPSFIVGRVGAPTTSGSPYYTNNWDNDTNRDLTQLSSINWQLAPAEKITDLQAGPITAYFYNGNGLAHTETITPTGSILDQNSTPSGWISLTNLAVLATRVEGRLSLNVPINTVLGANGGYLRVLLEHEVGSNTYSEQIEFFKDSGGAPTLSGYGVTLDNLVPKYLSGVQFASTSGSNRSSLVFTTDLINIWANTYRADPLTINSSSLGVPNYVVSYNSVAVTKDGVSPPVAPFNYSDDFQYEESKEITSLTTVVPDSNGSFPTFTMTARDPFNTVNSPAISANILINTYPKSSTDVLELFVDEDYRLLENSDITVLSAISGSGRASLLWDSTQSLVSYSGLQVINGALIFPQNNFSGYSPLGNPDYSGIPSGASELVYVRRFRDTLGDSRTNGIIRIEGLTESDRSSGNILVDIRVVGSHILGNGVQGAGNEGTGWLSLNTSYNSATFTGDDGDGCFTTVGGSVAPNFEFTLGNFATAYAANQAIEVRVTIKNPIALSRRIKKIHIVNWNQ